MVAATYCNFWQQEQVFMIRLFPVCDHSGNFSLSFIQFCWYCTIPVLPSATSATIFSFILLTGLIGPFIAIPLPNAQEFTMLYQPTAISLDCDTFTFLASYITILVLLFHGYYMSQNKGDKGKNRERRRGRETVQKGNRKFN